PTKEVYAVVERPAAPSEGAGDSRRTDAAEAHGQRQLRVLRWGLVPFWAKDPAIGNRMVNARMETVGEKPAFRQAFAKRRCLIPAARYHEGYPTEQKNKCRTT